MRTSRIWVRLVFVLLSLGLNAFAFIGCGGGGGSSAGGNPTGPAIAASSTQIDFGGVVLDNFSDRSVTVQNLGAADLVIGQIMPPLAPFAIVEDKCSDASLPPSGNCSLKIRFSPTNQNRYSGSFDITSNDRDQNPLAVNLSGIGRGLSVVINRIETYACSSQKLKLLISVTDRTGAAVLGLQEDNFALFENGQEVNLSGGLTIPPLQQLPASIGVALDYSGSMISETADLEAATLTFLSLLDFPNDEAEIIKFDKDIYVIQAFTTDETALISAVKAAFPGPRIRTSLYDAVIKSIDDTASRTNSRLAVIAVTDGQDLDSVHTLDGVIDHAVEKGVPVFTISIGDQITEVLQRLASETGGQYFSSPDSSDLQAIYSRVAEVLSNLYLIEYTTSSNSGKTVSLDVEVTTNGLQGADSKDAGGC